MRTDKFPLKEWTRRLSEEDMPVFAHTARSIAAASSEEDTPTTVLAEYILRDSSMTARILRLANSVYYNPAGQPVNTISRAIVFLGFNVVRSMAITIAILEPLLKGVQHERVQQEMARSLHAAVQARGLSQSRGNDDAEAVFVAALLNRLGNMAFWCFPYGKAGELDAAYQQHATAAQAETSALGFPLSQLTLALNTEWKLSELLHETLTGKNAKDPQNVDLLRASELVMAVEQGWDSKQAQEVIAKIASRHDLSPTEVKTMLQNRAQEAARIAVDYGAEASSRFIPLPKPDEPKQDPGNQSSSERKPDVMLQMGILRELTTMLHEKVELNAILGTIMEGLYRALGMDRTVIAFVSGGRTLQAKYALGDDDDLLKSCFQFPVKPGGNDLFSRILQGRQPFWSDAPSNKPQEFSLDEETRRCLGTTEFFIMPIWIGNQGKGVIYADCRPSGRQLNRDMFQVFSHFSEYATIAFELHSK